MLEAFFVSTAIVTLAEMGDKTQLLAFILAARFKNPVWIIIGILIATLVNHGLAAALGSWLVTAFNPQTLRWLLALSFIAMAGWTLIPDKLQEDTNVKNRWGVLGTTLIAFFLAEMGDKTQIATIALSAHYAQPLLVTMATTLGMLIANIPAVLIGHKLADRIPMKLVRVIAALSFVVIGGITLFKF